MALLFLAVLVVAVAVDTLRRYSRRVEPPRIREQGVISTQKIVIDLTKRL